MGDSAAEVKMRKEELSQEVAQRDFLSGADYLLRVWPVEMAQSGDQIVGFSLSQKIDGWLLVIRGKVDGVRQVVFLFDHTPTGCITLGALKAKVGTLRWRTDEYA